MVDGTGAVEYCAWDCGRDEFEVRVEVTMTAQAGETGTSERAQKYRLLKCAQIYGVPQLVGATITP